jgi:prepilin-type N-terminal cleavage/methylation domain-containing protein
MNRISRGFTLIELLVVIAIIGILSSVVLASLNSARVKGRDARRVSDVKQLQLALELYYDNNQSYPVGSGAASTTLVDLVSANFISSIPQDPTNSGSYTYSYASANLDGTACSATTCPSYIVRAAIEGSGAVPAGDVDDAGTNSAGLDCQDTGTPPFYCMRP